MSCETCKFWKRLEDPRFKGERGECVWIEDRRPFWAIGVLTSASVGDSCACHEDR